MFSRKSIFLGVILHMSSISFGGKLQTNLLPGKNVCGKDRHETNLEGDKTQVGEFPWMALVESRKSGFICGGSLISSKYVLTAAHCIQNDIFSVRLGEHNIQTEDDCGYGEFGFEFCSEKPKDIEIEDTVVHEHYDRNTSYADIALIRLKHEVTFSDFIKPICLPLSLELRNRTYVNSTVVISGWGQTENGWASKVKLKIAVPIVSNRDCSSVYGIYNISILNSHICAGGDKGKGSCYGDSGGPLMYLDREFNNENWNCIGLVVFGLRECALKNVPTVYTRLSDYVPWIIDNMKP